MMMMMMPELLVAEEVTAGLSAEEAKAGEGFRTGWILGLCGGDSGSACCALGLLRAPEDTEPSEAATRGALAEALPLLPVGIQVIGGFAAGTGSRDAAARMAEGCPSLPSGYALVAAAEGADEGGPSKISYSWRQQAGGDLKDAEVSGDATGAHEALDSGYVRVSCRLPLHCHLFEAPGRTWEEAVEDAVEALAGDLIASRLAFVFREAASDPGAAAASGKGGKKGSSGGAKGSKQAPAASGGAVLKLGWSTVEGTVIDLPGAAAQQEGTFLEAAVLTQASGLGKNGEAGDEEDADGDAAAPVARYRVLEEGQGDVSVRPARIHLDLLAYIPRSAAAAGAAETYLLPGLLGQLRACGEVLKKQEGCEWVKVYQFELDGMPFPVAAAYLLPDNAGDSTPAGCEKVDTDNLPTRQRLHASLGLPMDRPLLRVANARAPLPGVQQQQQQPAAGPVSTRLADVHIGLPPSGVNGTVTTILGTYDYYHYMQDRFDDNGWGCAYRSLQTIMSWFRKQHYTSKPVLSHREIQKTLVDLGDKPSSFVGSRNWIGAIELNYVLDTHMGVTCKVMTVSAGSEMPSKAREIAQHFETQGTPIMIGGGVLAYTLLGIDYNESTGDAAFLILDPHYTGGEDLKRIQSGTWVWWKKPGDKAAAGGELFVQDAFYNLLCPQRPQEI